MYTHTEIRAPSSRATTAKDCVRPSRDGGQQIGRVDIPFFLFRKGKASSIKRETGGKKRRRNLSSPFSDSFFCSLVGGGKGGGIEKR